MANRIEWEETEHHLHGQCGMIRYQVSPPNMTPGWRVWCMLRDPAQMASSVGGLIVTVKAPNLSAAKEAAERHLAELIKGLQDRPVYQCRDYADGWITFDSFEEALKYHDETDALMRVRPDTPGA